MLKIAKVVAETAVFDCIVVDMSAHGARVRFGAATVVPDVLTLKLADGTSYDARRRWTRGEEAGLEFIADTSLSGAARRQAWALQERLAQECLPPLEALRAAGYFADEVIRAAALTAEAGLGALQAVLARRGLPPSHSAAASAASTGVLSGTGPLQSMAAGRTSTAATTPARLRGSPEP